MAVRPVVFIALAANLLVVARAGSSESCPGDPPQGCELNCGRLCSNYNKDNATCPTVCNLDACDCEENYVFDEIQKKCVLPDDCSEADQSLSTTTKKPIPPKKKKKCKAVKKCQKNEEFSFCIHSIGREQYCSQKGQIPYYHDASSPCVEGCVCKEDYLRSSNGTCILATECEANCDPTEILNKCPSDCPSDYCPTSEKESKSCEPADPDDCSAPVCKCGFNHRRADNGTCIPTRNCPAFSCNGPNEQFDSCPPLCPTDDCSQATPTGECPQQFGRIGIVLPCEPTCRCIKGYWRNNGTCVPYEECPNVPKCGDGEFLDTCPTNCPPESCPKTEQESNPVACPKAKVCPPPECKCRTNFKRAENGTCIPARNCPPFDCSSKPNEEYNSCPPYCPSDECGQPRLKGQCPYRMLIALQCHPKCQCKDGYGRSNGTCVPFEECPDLCPANEEYNSCTQAVCRPQNCSELNGDPKPCPTIEESSCTRGCVCKENFYRNTNGTCVPKEQCIGTVCNDDEYLDTCPADCPSEYCPTCEEDNASCPNPEPCPPPRCKCKFNSRRAENGTCIPTEQCPPFECSNPNEKYTPCPPICPSDSCGLARATGICPYRIGIRLECNPKCQCEDGYGRLNGTCVPLEDCPSFCQTNEVYTNSSIIPSCKLLDTCKSFVARIKCPGTEKPGCICKDGFKRLNDTSPCMPSCDCKEIANTDLCK